MKALVTAGDRSFKLQNISVPALALGQILVRVVAAAQNPTDWNILGSDFAGTVVALGIDVPTDLRKLGERVAGFIFTIAGISANGAFSEYVAIDAAVVIAIPETMTSEHAAQLGVACFTVCQSLYQCLCLPTPLAPSSSLYQCLRLPTPLAPSSVPDNVLIWSGTSATGQYAVQFAKLGGLRVIATPSPRHFEFVRSLGADEVFNYADSHTAKRISAAGGGGLRYTMDCISEGMTPNQVSMSLGREGGTVATLLPYQSRRQDVGVNTVLVLSYSVFGKEIEFPFPFAKNLEHYQNAKTYARLISEVLVLSRGTVKPVPVRLYPHGLASVQQGFEDMKDGKVGLLGLLSVTSGNRPLA
ncbi:dehydrogenase [Mycena galopus ATCC 62051]|nr:dehydrogenase [Mycena galopus ATCC 62051]